MKCFGTNLYNYQKMRKFYSFIIAALAVIAAASCNKELQDVPQQSGGEVITFTAQTVMEILSLCSATSVQASRL